MDIRNARPYALEIADLGVVVPAGETVDIEDRDLAKSLLDQPDNWQPASGTAPLERPAESAGKPKWVAWAVFTGMDEDEANALTKAELVERFAEPAEPAEIPNDGEQPDDNNAPSGEEG